MSDVLPLLPLPCLSMDEKEWELDSWTLAVLLSRLIPMLLSPAKAKLSLMLAWIISVVWQTHNLYTMSQPLGISCKNVSLKVAEKVAGSFTKSACSASIHIADGSCVVIAEDSKRTGWLTVCLNEERIFLTRNTVHYLFNW